MKTYRPDILVFQMLSSHKAGAGRSSSGRKTLALMRAAVPLALALFITAATPAQTTRLERGWQFLADKEGALTLDDLSKAQGWRAARTGLSWNAQFEDLRDYMGVAWYRTSFDATQISDGRHALLRFGAVDYFCEVYVNGKRVGAHEGGYTPFAFEVTDAIKPGANELAVRVIDPPMDEKENRARFPEMIYKEIPHGKQNWYVQTGGIWQPVWLDIRPKTYITGLKVIPKLDGSLRVMVSSNGNLGPPPPAQSAGRPSAQNTILDLVSVRIIDPTGKSFVLKLKGGGGVAQNDYVVFEGNIPEPLLWSLERPNLYTAEAKLGDDLLTDRFGFRQFEARDGKLYLNNQPFYMMAALDQDFYPDTIYSSPPEEFVRDMMLKGKRLGLNMLRCHIKVPDPIYLKVADEVGMLIWYEIPSWNDFNHFSVKAAERGEKTFADMVERDWNHPSIVIQSIINESWGADLKQEEQRKWLRAAYERAKRMTAPLGRLIVDNSPCCNNFHVKSDIDDFHQYYSIPDNHARWDRWVADFAARPKWSYSPHGDAERTTQEPLIVSEFGNWGLPRLPRQLPWWFPRDFGGREVTRPAGVFDRFKQFKFDRLFKEFNALAEESEWHQFISLKHEIEEIRRHPSVQGYVITEFTDINWEANGLMDMWRNPKVYATELAKIQQPDVILARAAKRNYAGGERVEFETMLSHYSDKELNGARVRWRTDSGARGEFGLSRPIDRASVAPLQAASFTAPEVVRPRRERVILEARARNDALLAENSYEVFIYPKVNPAKDVAVVFHDPAAGSAKLAQALAAAGYKVSNTGTGNKSLMIATRVDDTVKHHLEGGGRAVIVADSKEALPETWRLKIKAREGSDLDGNWVTNFNWVRSDTAPFDSVSFTRLLGFEAAGATPQHVIEGVPGEDFSDVMSGIFYGWLNNNAALAVQMRVGSGRLFVTTFRFSEYGTDLYATHLLDGIIRYVSGPGFAPKMQWAAAGSR